MPDVSLLQVRFPVARNSFFFLYLAKLYTIYSNVSQLPAVQMAFCVAIPGSAKGSVVAAAAVSAEF